EHALDDAVVLFKNPLVHLPAEFSELLVAALHGASPATAKGGKPRAAPRPLPRVRGNTLWETTPNGGYGPPTSHLPRLGHDEGSRGEKACFVTRLHACGARIHSNPKRGNR